MKKVKSFLKSNVKVVIAFILGVIVFSVSGAILFQSDQVSYTKNSQSTVKGALDELYTKATTWINPMNMGTPTNYIFDGKNVPTTSSPTTPPSGKNIYLGLYEDGQYGVCIKRNGTQHCFRYKNWIAEKEHILRVFSDVSCFYYGIRQAHCNASDFYCIVESSGTVSCTDPDTWNGCVLYGDVGEDAVMAGCSE